MTRSSAFSRPHRRCWRLDAERDFSSSGWCRIASRMLKLYFSPAALDYVRQQLEALGRMDGVAVLLERRADDFRDIEPSSFDVVILNSA